MREPAFQFPGSVCGRAREERVDSAAICINGGGGGKRAFISALDREKRRETVQKAAMTGRAGFILFLFIFIYF